MSSSEYRQRRLARHGTNERVILAANAQYNAYKYEAYNQMVDAREDYRDHEHSRAQSTNDRCHSDTERAFYRHRTGDLFPEYHYRLIERATKMARATKRLIT